MKHAIAASEAVMELEVERFGKRLALELPEDWVVRFRLQEGDKIDAEALYAALQAKLRESDERRRQAVERIREHARPLPPDYKFDREEANWRPAMDRW
jgi:antitoxin MazE